MRRAASLVLLISLLLALAGCGSGAEESTLRQAQQRLAQAEEIRFTAQLHAASGEKVLEYTLACVYTEHTMRLCIQQPESLAGISAQVDEKDLVLRWEDVSLAAEPLTESGITPLTVLPCLLQGLLEGHLQRSGRESWQETPCLTGEFAVDTGPVAALWLREEDAVPVYGELWENGVRKASCEITAWDCR